MSELQRFFVEFGRPMRVAANAVLLSRGHRAAALFQVQSGKVLIHTTTANGREIGIEIIGAGTVFGVTAFVPTAGAIVDAVALTECELLSIDSESAQKLLAEPGLAVSAFEGILALLANCILKIEELSAYNLKARLARWLLEQFRAQGIKPIAGAMIEIETSQRLIATMAGVSRETVNRQLRKWQQAGVLELSGGKLRVFKPEDLEQLTANRLS